MQMMDGKASIFIQLSQQQPASSKFDERDLSRIPDYHAVIHLIKNGQYLDPEIIQIKTPSLKKGQKVVSTLKQISRLKYGRDRKNVEKVIQNRIERVDESDKK